MSNTKKIMLAVIVIVVVIIIVALSGWYVNMKRASVASPSGSGTTGLVTPTSSTRTDAPTNVAVPDKGASNVAANVAVPVVQGAGDPAGNVSYRSFNIAIQNGAYTPNTVVVKQGDTVDLEFTAADAAYDFTQPDYGFNAAIAKGKTQKIQFQALATGNFIFYCASCGGPSKGPVGHIIVASK
jgi:heme/copper-type cytochrome/quinol oxidase subunit 2